MDDVWYNARTTRDVFKTEKIVNMLVLSSHGQRHFDQSMKIERQVDINNASRTDSTNRHKKNNLNLTSTNKTESFGEAKHEYVIM